MSFRLLVECTKDIDKLAIDFSDGTSVIQSKSDKKPKSRDELDLDSEFGELSQDVIEKPNIQELKRPAKVAGELQNLNI